MNWRERISSDPAVLLGKPVVKGTRISVELILGWLAKGWTHEQILESYPHICRDGILALAFPAPATWRLRSKGVELIRASPRAPARGQMSFAPL